MAAFIPEPRARTPVRLARSTRDPAERTRITQLAPSVLRFIDQFVRYRLASDEHVERLLESPDPLVRFAARTIRAERDGSSLGINTQMILSTLAEMPGGLVDLLEEVGPTPQVLAAWNSHLTPTTMLRSRRVRVHHAAPRQHRFTRTSRRREHRSPACRSSTRRAAGAGARSSSSSSSDDGPSSPEPAKRRLTFAGAVS